MFKAEVVEKIPDRSAGSAKWVRLIESFLGSKAAIMRFKNDTPAEAESMYKGFTQARRLKNYMSVLEIKKRRNDIYLKRRG